MKPLIVPFFIAHQGCPHRCVFCDQLKISGAAETVPTPAELLDKIAAYRDYAGGRAMEAAFFGGTFTTLPVSLQEQLLLPLQPLLESGALSSVRVSTRPDAVDHRTAEFLWEMGVRTVELGVQSMDDDVLSRAGRGHTACDAETACRLLAKGGFRLGVQLMTGLPGDTAETALVTLRQTLALKPDFLRIYPT
ncbi:MAG TPA: radical SAM protein, partial [Geobacteraceae bacterium]|nr:radical SAM protein [Geobacteraceae bacterium]